MTTLFVRSRVWMSRSGRRLALTMVAALIAEAATGCASSVASSADAEADAEPDAELCRAELRSWIVLGRGRHLFLDIDCPAPNERLSGVVEFHDTAHRAGYEPPAAESRASRVAKVNAGVRIQPPFVPPDNRLEAVYEITLEQAACLQRDRVFSRRYALIGPNSNSAMRQACETCDLSLPEEVVEGAGPLGEFPGVGMDPGEPIPPRRWPKFGLPDGPEPTRGRAR